MSRAPKPTGPISPLQRQRDIAVVIPTLLRPSLVRAVESVFAQDFRGTIHVLIGVDFREGDIGAIETIRQRCPEGVTVTVLDPGYSTSKRRGGFYANWDGGALRTVLSYLANARLVAYLDDDNWWAPDHLSSLHAAIQGKGWAFSLRWYVDPDTQQPLCVDEWESVGPGRGVYAQKAGGFVDTSSLMIDKVACEPVLRLWASPLFPEAGEGSDRSVFNGLVAGYPGAGTGRATCYYVISADDRVHHYRVAWIREKTGGANPAGQ